MEDREIIKKLNKLKIIKADDNWKKNYREILFSQISAGATDNQTESNLRIIWQNLMPGKIFKQTAKPLWLTFLVSVLILVIGVGGVYAAKNSKPGDSLYIAKIISEKAQLAVTFNEKDKAKLGLEFATNRAKEITQVLKESKESAVKKDKKIEQLSQNFKKEISQVKNRLTIIKASESQEKKEPEEKMEVFGANLGKNDERMELAEPVKPAVEAQVQPLPAATTTKENLIEEAEKMFDEKNYDSAIDKLEEAHKVINQASKDGGGIVEGASETATSTE